MTPSAQWPIGRAEIEQMLAGGELERVPANREGAETLIAKARQHLESAKRLASDDPELGVDALHTANRKACDAVLLNQGLRPTRFGGHIASLSAVGEQTRTGGRINADLRAADTIRRLRNAGDYGNAEQELSDRDVIDNVGSVQAVIDACEALVGQMPVFV